MSEDHEGQMQVEVGGEKEWRNIDHILHENWRQVAVPAMRSNERYMTTIDGRTIIYKVSE